jgi:hypothetical protein
MIAWAVRFEHGISEKLQKLGCKKLERIDDYHSLWVVIHTNVAFSVPEFEGDKCLEVMWLTSWPQ